MKIPALIAGSAACMLLAGQSHAGLAAGSQFDVTVSHPGIVAAVHSGTHTWGGADILTEPFGRTMTLNSMTPVIGYENALHIDLTGMFYASFFPNSLATMNISGIDEAVDGSSITVLSGGTDITGTALSLSPDSIMVTWNTADVIANSTPLDNVTILWNSQQVPAPGAIALLGLSGFAATRRRRRS
ncbi:MAG: PEP-CTERM sorting domain-containing protein [Phycisphaerales bacterium]|nr:PEP-CTERM sorting domain-containing protein [Phycisphaerales bacterium]